MSQSISPAPLFCPTFTQPLSLLSLFSHRQTVCDWDLFSLGYAHVSHPVVIVICWLGWLKELDFQSYSRPLLQSPILALRLREGHGSRRPEFCNVKSETVFLLSLIMSAALWETFVIDQPHRHSGPHALSLSGLIPFPPSPTTGSITSHSKAPVKSEASEVSNSCNNSHEAVDLSVPCAIMHRGATGSTDLCSLNNSVCLAV